MDSYKFYTSKPEWAIDLNIYVGSDFYPATDWTDDQLEDYTTRLRNALTANGNIAYVNWEESNIVIFASSNGDNARFLALLDEAYAHGAWVEIESADENSYTDLRESDGRRVGCL